VYDGERQALSLSLKSLRIMRHRPVSWSGYPSTNAIEFVAACSSFDLLGWGELEIGGRGGEENPYPVRILSIASAFPSVRLL